MAPDEKDATIEGVSQIDHGMFTVGPALGASNPYAAGGSSPNSPAVMSGGYVAPINGRRVPFASEADAESADVALSELRGGASVRELNAGWNRDGGNGTGARFLLSSAEAAAVITNFLRGRKMRQKSDELRRALRISTAERDKRSGHSSRYSDRVLVHLD